MTVIRYWNGKTLTSPRSGITYAHYATVHQVMNLIYAHKRADLKACAATLRDRIKFEFNVCNVFTKFAAEIPVELLAQAALSNHRQGSQRLDCMR